MQINRRKASKRALCIGINKYPYEDSNLRGCVNDAHAWAALLTENFDFSGTDVKLLFDNEATKYNIINALEDLLAGAQKGDTLVFTNSSHGSYIADVDGDELNYDEILCPYDIDSNYICDDELRELFAGIEAGVNLTVILDNCFSGTGTRDDYNPADVPGALIDARPRFLSPALRGDLVLHNSVIERTKSHETNENKYSEVGMKEILLSGCSDIESSYDAFFGDRYHGALSYHAIRIIKEAGCWLTYAELHERVGREIKPFPQTPQLEGNTMNKTKQIFS